MKIHINPKDFSPKFRLAASVAACRDIKPILQGIKVNADKQQGVILQATDAEVGRRLHQQSHCRGRDCSNTSVATAQSGVGRQVYIGHCKKSATQHLKYIPRSRLGLLAIACSLFCTNPFNSSFVFA